MVADRRDGRHRWLARHPQWQRARHRHRREAIHLGTRADYNSSCAGASACPVESSPISPRSRRRSIGTRQLGAVTGAPQINCPAGADDFPHPEGQPERAIEADQEDRPRGAREQNLRRALRRSSKARERRPEARHGEHPANCSNRSGRTGARSRAHSPTSTTSTPTPSNPSKATLGRSSAAPPITWSALWLIHLGPRDTTRSGCRRAWKRP